MGDTLDRSVSTNGADFRLRFSPHPQSPNLDPFSHAHAAPTHCRPDDDRTEWRHVRARAALGPRFGPNRTNGHGDSLRPEPRVARRSSPVALQIAREPPLRSGSPCDGHDPRLPARGAARRSPRVRRKRCWRSSGRWTRPAAYRWSPATSRPATRGGAPRGTKRTVIGRFPGSGFSGRSARPTAGRHASCARLTLGQLVAYLDDEPQPTDRVRLPAAEARALARETRKKRRGRTSKRGGTP